MLLCNLILNISLHYGTAENNRDKSYKKFQSRAARILTGESFDKMTADKSIGKS